VEDRRELLAVLPEGAEPSGISNDRRIGGLGVDWRRSLDTRTQVGLGVQASAVRFPDNPVEDFDQVLVQASWLKSFEAKGAPMLYLTAFASEDRAINELDNGVTKSKNLGGVRSYLQYSVSPKLQVFGGLGGVYRRDKELGARGAEDVRGRDVYGEAAIGPRLAVPRCVHAAAAVCVHAQPVEHRYLRFQSLRDHVGDSLRPVEGTSHAAIPGGGCGIDGSAGRRSCRGRGVRLRHRPGDAREAGRPALDAGEGHARRLRATRSSRARTAWCSSRWWTRRASRFVPTRNSSSSVMATGPIQRTAWC
jgi:hypothetical protein